jgi:glycosyltransferase involved in cell wall biosynthesis
MRIGIDIRCLAEGKRTGVEEYVLNLLPNIFEIDKKNEYLLFFNSFKESKVDLSWTNKYSNVSIKKFSFPNKIINLFFWYFNFPKIDSLLGGIDLFFMPNLGFGSVSNKCKLILTVHDLSFERFPDFFSLKRKWWHIFINPKKICQRADKIIAVSESTKNDLISLYQLPESKIVTIRSAISDKFAVISRNDPRLLEVKEKYGLPYRFILYLGTIEPRKNIQSIVLAFDELQKNVKKYNQKEVLKYKLVIAGGIGWKYEEIFSCGGAPICIKDAIFTGAIKEKDKVYLYNLASVFVYPSFFEGFGFPPLEAMASGVPVICSNNSSLPEVAGNAAIMIDPDRPDEIRIALEKVISNKDFREKIVQKGLIQAEKFNLKKTAKETLRLFRL